MTDKVIPFGPGHPDFENQLDLFEDSAEPRSRQSGNGVRVKRAENMWHCPISERMVEAKDLPSAKRKLGAGSRPEPALIEYGGYSDCDSHSD